MTVVNVDYLWRYRPVLLELVDQLSINRIEAKDTIEVLFKHITIVADLINNIIDSSGAAEVAISRARKRLKIAGKTDKARYLDRLSKILDEGTYDYVESLKKTLNTLHEIIMSMVILYNEISPPDKRVKVPPPPSFGGEHR